MACLGLQPASIEMRTTLSPVLEDRLDGLVAAAAARLEAWGHPLCRRAVAAHA